MYKTALVLCLHAMNRGQAEVSRGREMSATARSGEPLRGQGIGPALLSLYLAGLVVIEFLLVTFGNKTILHSC